MYLSTGGSGEGNGWAGMQCDWTGVAGIQWPCTNYVMANCGASSNGNWQSAGLGFAGFNMQNVFAANYNNCTGAFHQSTVGSVVQLGSLTSLTPLNSNYADNWYETLSLGSVKAAFLGGMKAGSAMVGEAVEGAIGVVASPFLLTATGIDTNVDAVCAGSAVLASAPPSS